MEIVIDPLDSKSIERALKQIEAYKNSILQKEQELLKRLGEIGVQSVNAKISIAQYQKDFDLNSLTAKYNIDNNIMTLQVDGKDICFIEFGAGVKNGLGYEGPKPSGIVEIGKYGLGRGSNPNGWYYRDRNNPSKKRHSWGNIPNAPIYTTYKELIEKVIPLAREVFSE